MLLSILPPPDNDLLTTLGRIAALVLIIYVFLFAVLFFVASLLLLYGNAWLREKIGLLHQLRVIVENVDTAIHSPSSETLPATLETDNRLGQALQAIHMVQSVHVVEIAKNTQKQADSIEKMVEPVADRIADGVIEIRARTVMAQGILKAFFLPGLIKLKPRDPLLLPEALSTDRPVINAVPVSGSRLPVVSSNVVVTQLNPPDEVAHPTITGAPDQLQSEGTKQSDNAPGH
jgi:hypothetical protein